jgi:hypothetical protein
LNDNTPIPEAIEVIVCPACREKYRELREANYRRSQLEQKNREERSKQEDERREYHTSWRNFTPEEVDRTTRSMQFRAILPNFRLYEIAFGWRATSGEGRGDSPPNVVGMWVDGKLVAHYFGWNLRPSYWEGADRGEDPIEKSLDFFDLSNNDDICDIFAPGLAMWMEREFQDRLCNLNPAAVWRASSPRTFRFEDGPMLVHTVWIDGQTCAALLIDRLNITTKRMTDWALTNLELRIEEVVHGGARADAPAASA